VGAPHLRQGGPSGNPTGPRDAADPGSTRYAHRAATGANDPTGAEATEERGWSSRQGGDQTADTPGPQQTERRR
jgi:hypothetical protein